MRKPATLELGGNVAKSIQKTQEMKMELAMWVDSCGLYRLTIAEGKKVFDEQLVSTRKFPSGGRWGSGANLRPAKIHSIQSPNSGGLRGELARPIC